MMLLVSGAGLSVVSAVWLLLDAVFLVSLSVHVLGDWSRCSALCAVFQDLLRYGKTKAGQGRPAWLRCFDLPKRWFSHFYYLSVLWNGALLWIVIQSQLFGIETPQWLQSLLNVFNKEPLQKISGAEVSTLLALSLIWLHSLRRLSECLYVSVYSNGVIHVAQYCLGIVYYLLIGITLLDHTKLQPKTASVSDLALQVHWYHIMGTVLYIWASIHQHKCHIILANLRKNKSGKVVTMKHVVPYGDWFERVSCPHYFAELLIYISIAVIFGLSHTTWWLVVLFVLFNQSLAAILCHEFYHQKFDNYPAHRKAFLPYVY